MSLPEKTKVLYGCQLCSMLFCVEIQHSPGRQIDPSLTARHADCNGGNRPKSSGIEGNFIGIGILVAVENKS